MKWKYLIICLLLLIIYGCDAYSQHKITVKNQTNVTIDSIIISTNKCYIKFKNLHSGDKTSREFNIVKDKSKYKKAFLIRIYVNGILRKSGTFGYFANNADIKDKYKITIYGDFKYREDQ